MHFEWNMWRTKCNKIFTCLVFETPFSQYHLQVLWLQKIQRPRTSTNFGGRTRHQISIRPVSCSFTNVGIDYIGSFAVIQRNKEEKAYFCLFNCLATRAVHLEVTEDLSTTACLTAIRRFISRRGEPRVFLRDNGNNFLGARKQIRRQPLKLDHESVRQKRVSWIASKPSFCCSFRWGVGEARQNYRTRSSYEFGKTS